MNERLSKEDYAFGLTLGTKNNDRETPGDTDVVYHEKTYHMNVKNNRIRHAVFPPTQSAINKYGESSLYVVIFKDVKPAEKSTKDGYEWMIKAKTTIKMPLTDFIKLFGKLPKLNSAGVKINLNL